MAKIETFRKDMAANVPFTIDWRNTLEGAIVADSQWRIQAGLVKTLETRTDTMTAVWLSGGRNGVAYLVSNTVTLSDGRVERRSFYVDVGVL